MNDKGLKYRFFKNRLFSVIIFLFSISALIPLFLIFYYIFKQGISAINWEFLVEMPKPPGEAGGGIANAIVGTFLLLSIAGVLAFPLGVAAGVYLYEFKKNKLADWVRLGVEIIQGVPSVVIGIIAYVWIVLPFGFSAVSGGIALAIMMIPMIIRSTEETLLLTPDSLKEASLSLGVPYYKTIIKVTIPAGLSGIVTGSLLGISRIAGETAPLLFTAFGSDFMNLNILKPVRALPHSIYIYSISPYPEWHQLAWAASLVLIVMVLSLNLIAKYLAGKWKIQY
ncbi:phosphate ABC transporter permease PstA [candidate division KSB1 bacterium]